MATKAATARAIEMLKVATTYIREYCPDQKIFYDGTYCDGYCVADDCEVVAEELEQFTVDHLEALTAPVCPDCGTVGERKGHMTCQYPQD